MYNYIWIIRFIKKIMPFRLKIILIRLIILVEKIMFIKLHLNHYEYSKKKKIFILLSTDYSNLGDHAMTYAQEKYLMYNFPDYEIIEVTVNDTLKQLYSIKACINQDDIITLKGGGNIGVEYFREELIRRTIIQFFPNNKIVMFPQTVFFPKTVLGNDEFKKTVQIYSSHKNFHCFFRDSISYNLMKKYLSKIYCIPDIVLSLNKLPYCCKKSGDYAVVCMRNDVEGVYTKDDKEIVYNILDNKAINYICVDTVKEYNILVKDREKELLKIWDIIGNAKLVITDRLHGMIFSALLGIPCVVLNTYNHKVKSQYKWLENLNYIKSCEIDSYDLSDIIQEVLYADVNCSELKKLNEYYKLLRKAIVE